MPSAHGTQCGLEAPSRRTAMRSFITDPVTGGVAALIVTVATVIAMYVALFGSPFSRGSEGKTATRNVTGSFYGSTPAEPAPACDATSPKTGDCLTDSFTYSNCSSQHKFEIYQVPRIAPRAT